MSRSLIVHSAGPSVCVQDLGRPGYLAYGLSQGGAADQLALAEGAALLGQPEDTAALELAGIGGTFEATEDTRIALTGAPMRASIDTNRIVWNASHLLPKGAQLTIGAAETGSYGYLHLGGGVQTPEMLGARAAHLAAGLGHPLQSGDEIPIGPDSEPTGYGFKLEPDQRFQGGTIRILPSLQTGLFAETEIERFETMTFHRDLRGNRMGVRLIPDGEGLHTEAGLSVLSEVIIPGDVQITGDGTPFVLLGECQTTGGYPRIGSVLPADLPRIVQAQPGCALQFQFISLESAVSAERQANAQRAQLRSGVQPLIRDPHQMQNLLSFQMISGVSAGDELERTTP